VRKVGGLRSGFEGAQDYDLCLRCLAETDPARIRHIPHVLYHWRAIPGSTSIGANEKSYASRAGQAALVDHLARMKVDARVEHGRYPTTYRVRYPIGASPPKVSLIVPTRDGYEILKQCLESIREKTTYPNYEIVIVDNQSTDPRTLDYMERLAKEDGRVRLLRYDHPFNYSAINNFAVSQTSTEIIGLVNNDIEVIAPEWLDEMVSHATRPEIGVVGARLLYPDGRLQHGGVILGICGIAGHFHKYNSSDAPGYFARGFLVQNLSAVTAACALVRRSVFDEAGGLDAENLPVAFNDVDFCVRVREAGYRNLWTPYAELFHHESVSRGLDTTPEQKVRAQGESLYMKRRWGRMLVEDPYYSPNLTLDSEDCSLGHPPRRRVPWREAPLLAPVGSVST
jgi:O-antigen biosynthesis protein